MALSKDFYGTTSTIVNKLSDISGYQFYTLVTLAIVIIVSGIFPELILQFLHQPAKEIIDLALSTQTS